MPFMQQDTRPVIDSRGNTIDSEPVGKEYEAVYVQNRATQEVTLQSVKAASQFFGESTKFRFLTQASGERLIQKQVATGLKAKLTVSHSIAAMEVDAAFADGDGEPGDAFESDADEEDAFADVDAAFADGDGEPAKKPRLRKVAE